LAFLTRNTREGRLVKDIAGGILAVDDGPIFENIRNYLKLSSVTPAAPSG
jgi:hypothetical protein